MAETLKGQIRYPHADGTIFGPGCVRERLQETLEELGIQRPFLLSTPSLTRTPLLPAVRGILGDAQAGEFTASRAHTHPGKPCSMPPRLPALPVRMG